MISKIKFLLPCTLYILLGNFSFAQEKLKLESNIKQVVLYQNKAQITNYLTNNLDAGVTDVVVTGLPLNIENQSIQASGKGDITILGVKLLPNYTKPLRKSAEINYLEDTLDKINIQVEHLESKAEILEKEAAMMLSNQVVSGKDKALTADEFEDYVDFFRDRLLDIKHSQSKVSRDLAKKREIQSNFQQQLNSIVSKLSRPSSEITVTVQAKNKTTFGLELQYLVPNAGWEPIYDLRSKGTNAPMQLIYKANVYQNTGIDWDNIKLKLSTGSPSNAAYKQELYPWYLNIYFPTPKRKSNHGGAAYRSAPSYDDKKEEGVVYEAEAAPMVMAKSLSESVTVTEQQFATEFEIPATYSVNADNKPVLVEVQNYQLPAEYKHFSTPKLDNNVYLSALLTGWESFNLIPGNAQVFFDGTYVGETYLNLSSTNDTLNVALGKDRKIIAKRETLKEFTSKSFLGNTKKNEYAYEISLKNTKKDSANIVLEDQIPVSQNADIVVEILENGGASYDPATGKLVWNLHLASGEEKKVNFRFTVKYPKNKNISGL